VLNYSLIKTKEVNMYKRKVKWAFYLLAAAMLSIYSCTKNTDELYDDSDSKAVPINENDFGEKDEDLLNVDYYEFYDELEPHGEWVQVSAKELGIDLKEGESAGESGSLLNDLIGVKTAQADDFGFGMFFVWRPSPNLAVSVVAGEPPVYVPYYNGTWVYTDAGWYFRAPTPYEEITHHYGRWAWHPVMGWVWIPGRVWAPAWVEWRVSTSYIAWAPLPPSVYIVNYYVSPIVIHEDRYIFVERGYFCEPHVYRHSFFYRDHKHKIKVYDMYRPDGIVVVNNRVVNRGPDVFEIEKRTGRNIEHVKINRVQDKRDVKYSDKEFSVYSPKFERIRGSESRREPVSKPDKFIPLSSKGTKDFKRDEGSMKQDNKNLQRDNNDRTVGSKKAGKEFGNDRNSKKLGDDRGMKNKESLDRYNKNETDKQRNEYKQKNDNKQRKDNKQRNDNKQWNYDKQKNESKQRDSKQKNGYKQKNENKQKDSKQKEGYKQKNNNKQREGYNQRNDNKQNDGYEQRGTQKNYKQDKGKRNNVKYEKPGQSGNEKNKSYKEKRSEKSNNPEFDKKSSSRKESREKKDKNRRK
jgi:hypothetical protein